MGCPSRALVLDSTEWIPLQRAHESRVDAWIEPRNRRTSHGENHPVYDFLFEYYSYRPSALKRWHPGLGVALKGRGVEVFAERAGYRRDADGGVYADPNALKPDRRAFVYWLLEMLEASAARPGFFGCSGLHEWAMVFEAGPQRHLEWPLRLGQSGTDDVVRSQLVRCSHFDAFRFFTPQARPLNRLQPERTSTVLNEQPACLHANMDLYKWAYKLAPYSSSALVADAFAFACEIREIDMRASPYDFSALGFAPICIETPDGRSEFEEYQRGFAARAVPIRDQLVLLCRDLIGCWSAD